MAHPQNRSFPTFWQAILLLIFLVFILTFNGYLAVWVGIGPKDVLASPLVNAMINLLGFGFVTRLGFLRSGASFGEVFPFKRVSILIFAALLLAIGGLQILGSELDNILRTLAPFLKSDSLTPFFENGKPGELILLIVLLGPCYEEFLFRGLLVYGFSRNYGKTRAIWLSACLFGLMHLDPTRMIFATLFGVILAWVFLETGSLWPSIFGHIINNAMPFWLGFVPLAIPGFNRPGIGKVFQQPLWFDLLGVLLIGTAIFLLTKLFPTKKRI